MVKKALAGIGLSETVFKPIAFFLIKDLCRQIKARQNLCGCLIRYCTPTPNQRHHNRQDQNPHGNSPFREL